MQILSLSIYNSSGKRRDVAFRPGKLNIITGATKTGKTAIIGIIDYCLGRNDYVVPAGIIRNNVTWYVLHVQLDKTQAIIGRPAPVGSITTSDVFLDVGSDLTVPDYGELKRNMGSGQLVSFLGEQLGIAGNEHVPPEGRTRLPLQVNLKHARFLLFQPQYRIMAPDLMFYRQQEEFVSQAIRDSLPYFLGATQDDQYAKLQELRLARRELRLQERRLADEESVRGRDASRALALVEEARHVGILETGANTFEGAVVLLKALDGWIPSRDEAAPNNRIEALRQERGQLLSEFKAIQGEIDAAKAFTVAQDDYTAEITDQSERLAAIGLYRIQPNNTCPLCESELQGVVPTADLINQSIAELKDNIGSAFAQRPRLDEFVAQREERLSQLRRALSANKGSIEAIVEQEDQLRRERDRIAEQARVAGRVGLFLESLSAASTDGNLNVGIRKLQEKVDQLERELSDDVVEDRLESILRLMSRWMTEWGGQLEFEHAAWPLGFDLKHLTAISFRDDRPERMSEIGGGSNWLICHLVTHFALQKWFVKKKRPVPRFLVLDQPSQAYFPREKPFEGKVEDLSDKEREGVRRIFKFFYDMVCELSPSLQVIVTDHADLPEDWFTEAVIENWHEGDALVPRKWYE
ncbi:MAG TPA: DUF3732 domain-containing protein [Planctomicrobium sp.]|nr:DUF3732 domain-containing protein [Planctomicrobium sp.]